MKPSVAIPSGSANFDPDMEAARRANPGIIDFTAENTLREFWESKKFYQFVIGPLGCCAPETLILTSEGPVRIADIDRPTHVLSWDEKQGRFRNVRTSASFLKGRDAMYRVLTQRGAVRVTGHHRVLVEGRGYQHVRDLRAGDVVKTCSPDLIEKNVGYVSPDPTSPADARHSTQTPEGFAGRCGSLSHQYDPQLLRGAAAALARCGAPMRRLVAKAGRILRSSESVPHATLDYAALSFLRLLSGAPTQAAPAAYGCTGESIPGVPQNPWRTNPDVASKAREACVGARSSEEACSGSGSIEGSIISIEPDGVDWVWDISVEGTENYVTVDGMVHHNSTKTTNCIMKLLAYARLQTPGKDGIRRTRFAIARPTLQQIKTTVLQDIFTWFRPIIRYKVSESKIEIRVGDVESDWYLIPLENVEDQRRLLSMQLSGVYLNEFREIPLELMTAAAGRVDRYPRKVDGGCTNPFVMGDSNPPPEGGEWYNFLVLDKPEDCTYVHQPSGLSEHATWRQYLPNNYYERLIQGHDLDWVNTHVRSMWSPDLSGEAVFRKSFVPNFHIRNGLLIQPDAPVLIGADWGRTPAVLFGQVDGRGRLLIQHEITAVGMNVELFFSTEVKPFMLQTYTGLKHFLVGDPAGMAKSDRSEESIFDVLDRLGFNAVAASTNDIDPRLRAVESRLLMAPGGEAGLLIDEEGCPLLVRALKHEYKYARRKTGNVDDKPDKSHPWSDLCDSLEYLCLGVDANAVERATKREWRRTERQRQRYNADGIGGTGTVSPAGWT